MKILFDLSKSFTTEQKESSFLYLQEYINNKLSLKTPFFIGRLSGNEPNLCGKILSNEAVPRHLYNECLTTAGLQFKTTEDVKKYVKMYTASCRNSDILAVWDKTMYSQAKRFYDFLDKVSPTQMRICSQALEPYYFMDNKNYSFYESFKNKRVLIVTSHYNTTNCQTDKHATIFEKPIFHDTTIFRVYKPAQQNGGNHDNNSWVYHYDKMTTELRDLIKEYDFDIALISSGGFGMLLSDFIYTELNKSVIYVGGALQLFFGIIGNRWKSHPIICKLINEHWTKVLENDKPPTLVANPRLCENSCYW